MNKNRLFVSIIIFTGLVIPILSYAQVDTAWVRRYHGGYGTDFANAIAVDASGNVYIAGYTYYGSTQDMLTIKYLPNGDTAWVRRYNGAGNGSDWARAIAVDNSGNVYVTGDFENTGINGIDFATVKYNASGVQQWVRTYHGPGVYGSDYPKAIALDNAGNIYVTGISYNGTSQEDCVTIKYYPNNTIAWAAYYNNPSNGIDIPSAIAVDANGNFCIAGYTNETGTDEDFLLIQYNASGVQQWVRKYNIGFADRAVAVKYDVAGNILVTGYGLNPSTGNDGITLKYLANGDTAWVRTYNSVGANGDRSYALAVDNQNNVIITGAKGGANDDCLTVKYNANGVEQWVQSYNGAGNIDDQGNAVVVDNNNNIYITGFSYNTTYNYLTIKYNANGVQQWLRTYNGPGNVEDRAYAVAVDNLGYCYITGTSGGIGTDIDCATIKYVQTGAVEEIDNCKLSIEKLSIFPNPAKTYFTIRGPLSADRIIIYDVSGKIIKEIATTASQSRNDNIVKIPLRGIKSGVYFVKVDNTLKKLIISK